MHSVTFNMKYIGKPASRGNKYLLDEIQSSRINWAREVHYIVSSLRPRGWHLLEYSAQQRFVKNDTCSTDCFLIHDLCEKNYTLVPFCSFSSLFISTRLGRFFRRKNTEGKLWNQGKIITTFKTDMLIRSLVLWRNIIFSFVFINFISFPYLPWQSFLIKLLMFWLVKWKIISHTIINCF